MDVVVVVVAAARVTAEEHTRLAVAEAGFLEAEEMVVVVEVAAAVVTSEEADRTAAQAIKSRKKEQPETPFWI